MLITFGAGSMFATPKIDVNGAAVTVPSPVQFGIMQNITPDETFEYKELYGANQFPVAIGRGKGKMSLKAQIANISAELFNTIYYGVGTSSAAQRIYDDEIGFSIPTGTPFTVQPTSPTSIVVADLGVQSAVNGIPYTRVSSGPTGGQYSYATGVWTFASQDAARTPLINYLYSIASPGDAKLVTVRNSPMGTCPVFAIDLQETFQGMWITVRFPNVVATKLSGGYKNDDFTLYDLEMQASQDASGNIAYKYFSE